MTDRQKMICELVKCAPLPFKTIKAVAIKLIDAGATFGKQARWIPVTERLPELESYIYSVDVLFCDTDGIAFIGYVNFETGEWKDGESGKRFAKEKVTHWMPLPDEPKED